MTWIRRAPCRWPLWGRQIKPRTAGPAGDPGGNPAYKAAYLIYTVLGGPLGDLDRYENPQTMVINWAQDAFGGKNR